MSCLQHYSQSRSGFLFALHIVLHQRGQSPLLVTAATAGSASVPAFFSDSGGGGGEVGEVVVAGRQQRFRVFLRCSAVGSLHQAGPLGSRGRVIVTGVAEHAEHLPQLVGLGGRDPRLVVSPAPRRKEPRPGAVALRQRAGREDADRDDGEDDDCGDLLGKVTEKQEA